MENPIVDKNTSFYRYTIGNRFGYVGFYHMLQAENDKLLSKIGKAPYSTDAGVCIKCYTDGVTTDLKINMGYGMRFVPYTGYPVMVGPAGTVSGTAGKTEIIRFSAGTKTTYKKGGKNAFSVQWNKNDCTAPSKTSIKAGSAIISAGSAAHILHESVRFAFGAYGDTVRQCLITNVLADTGVDISKTLRESQLVACVMLSWQWGQKAFALKGSAFKALRALIGKHHKLLQTKGSAAEIAAVVEQISGKDTGFAHTNFYTIKNEKTGKPYANDQVAKRRRIEGKIYAGEVVAYDALINVDDVVGGDVGYATEEQITNQILKINANMHDPAIYDAAVTAAGGSGTSFGTYWNDLNEASTITDEKKKQEAIDEARDKYGKAVEKTFKENQKKLFPTVKKTTAQLSSYVNSEYDSKDWYNDMNIYDGLIVPETTDTAIKYNRLNHFSRFKKYKNVTELDVGENKYANVFFVRPDVHFYNMAINNAAINSAIEDLSLHNSLLVDEDVARFLDVGYRLGKFNTFFIPFMTNQFMETSVLDAKLNFLKSSANLHGVDVSVGRYDSADTADSDLSFTFNIDKYNSIYRTVDVWYKYIKALGHGTVKAKPDSIKHNRLDYTSTVYGFITGADGLTLNHWYSSIGITPTSNVNSSFIYKSSGDAPKEIQVSFRTNTPFENRKIETINEFNYLMRKPYNDAQNKNIDKYAINYNIIEAHIIDDMEHDDYWAETYRIIFEAKRSVFKLIPIPKMERVTEILNTIVDSKATFTYDSAKGSDSSVVLALKELFKVYSAAGINSTYFAEEFSNTLRGTDAEGKPKARYIGGNIKLSDMTMTNALLGSYGTHITEDYFTKLQKKVTDFTKIYGASTGLTLTKNHWARIEELGISRFKVGEYKNETATFDLEDGTTILQPTFKEISDENIKYYTNKGGKSTDKLYELLGFPLDIMNNRHAMVHIEKDEKGTNVSKEYWADSAGAESNLLQEFKSYGLSYADVNIKSEFFNVNKNSLHNHFDNTSSYIINVYKSYGDPSVLIKNILADPKIKAMGLTHLEIDNKVMSLNNGSSTNILDMQADGSFKSYVGVDVTESEGYTKLITDSSEGYTKSENGSEFVNSEGFGTTVYNFKNNTPLEYNETTDALRENIKASSELLTQFTATGDKAVKHESLIAKSYIQMSNNIKSGLLVSKTSKNELDSKGQVYDDISPPRQFNTIKDYAVQETTNAETMRYFFSKGVKASEDVTNVLKLDKIITRKTENVMNEKGEYVEKERLVQDLGTSAPTDAQLEETDIYLQSYVPDMAEDADTGRIDYSKTGYEEVMKDLDHENHVHRISAATEAMRYSSIGANNPDQSDGAFLNGLEGTIYDEDFFQPASKKKKYTQMLMDTVTDKAIDMASAYALKSLNKMFFNDENKKFNTKGTFYEDVDQLASDGITTLPKEQDPTIATGDAISGMLPFEDIAGTLYEDEDAVVEDDSNPSDVSFINPSETISEYKLNPIQVVTVDEETLKIEPVQLSIKEMSHETVTVPLFVNSVSKEDTSFNSTQYVINIEHVLDSAYNTYFNDSGVSFQPSKYPETSTITGAIKALTGGE